jgi:uncharacterized protein YgbK (DUF1537 family)
MHIEGGKTIIVNAIEDRDIEVFVAGLVRAEAQGKSFIFRTAASFVKIASGISDRQLLTRKDLFLDKRGNGGLIIFGSYVPKSTAQLEVLFNLEGIYAVELPVKDVMNELSRSRNITKTAEELVKALIAGYDALLFTSRELITRRNQNENLEIQRLISSALIDVVKQIDVKPRYVIGKGGITASDLATKSLHVKAARVIGQIIPGVPVWRLGPGSRWPGLVYIIFPGNIGDDKAVLKVVDILRK